MKKIMFVASEALPFVKIGGLSDVMGGLTKELVKNNVDVRIVIPLYDTIDNSYIQNLEFIKQYEVYLGFRKCYCGVFKIIIDEVTYYLLDNEYYFKRGRVYGEFDDGERFAFLSKASLDLCEQIEFYPDIIHVNDWHTSLVPVMLNEQYRWKDDYKPIKTVLSIHNIEFQGKYDYDIISNVFAFGDNMQPILRYDGCVNLLKAGIESSDRIITVSKTYAQEILQPENSYGLHHILGSNSDKIHGIVNGIDSKLFSPEYDNHIYKNYNVQQRNLKRFNKIDLQKNFGLKVDNNIPIIGMVGRLTSQKGLDLIGEVIHDIATLPIQLIILGTGYSEYENMIQLFEDKYYDNVRGYIGFSQEVASKIYAGSDFFLMPSKNEPCGLSQMIAMNYGTIPIVHSVGGLKDTVVPFNTEDKTGNGITFQSYSSIDMLDAINRAIILFNDKTNFSIIKKNAMNADFSWEKPALDYINLYNSIT